LHVCENACGCNGTDALRKGVRIGASVNHIEP